MKTGAKVIIGSIVALHLAVSIGVTMSLYYSSKPSKYTIDNGILNISGLYGQEIMITDISSLELKETILEIKFCWKLFDFFALISSNY